MILPLYFFATNNTAYIAGSGDGIVTVNGQPASRKIWLLDVDTLQVLNTVQSLSSGHYMFFCLNPAKQYLVMCRDYKKEFEPVVWDYVTPATDLSIAEQQALWDSWL